MVCTKVRENGTQKRPELFRPFLYFDHIMIFVEKF